MRGAEQERSGLAQAFGRITDGISRLVSDHLALARVELREDAKTLGLQVAKIAIFVPAVLVGYGLLCVAIALALRPWVGDVGAFAIVGGVNFVGGALGAYLAANKLSKHPVLETTRAEAQRTSQTLTHATRGGDGVEKRLGA